MLFAVKKMHLSTELAASVPVYVINDRYLGGTKARAITSYLKTKINEGYRDFVYAGPTGGAGFMTIATGASALGMRSTFFLCGTNNERVDLVRKLGSKVFTHFRNLREASQAACKHIFRYKDAYQVPFGVDDEVFGDALFNSIAEDVERLTPPRRVWVAVGSGCVLKALMKVWPDAVFATVEVGKFLTWEGLREPPGEVWRNNPIAIPRATSVDGRLTVYHHPSRFAEPARIVPPYPSLLNYDAKVWEYVCTHAEAWDVVWNVF